MADVQKVVAARIQATSLSAVQQPSLQPQGPRFGNIIAEESNELAPKEIRTVLWDNGLVDDVEADTVAELNLDVIEDPEADVISTFEGQVVLRVAPEGAVPGDAAGGTSREFSGLVIAIYKRTPIEAEAGSGEDFLLVFSSGTFFEDLAGSFTVLRNQTP
jgi:hypothetical protein